MEKSAFGQTKAKLVHGMADDGEKLMDGMARNRTAIERELVMRRFLVSKRWKPQTRCKVYLDCKSKKDF